jgi:alpha-L-rhamnosidase
MRCSDPAAVPAILVFGMVGLAWAMTARARDEPTAIGPGLTAVYLRCEYLVAPAGIDVRAPRLSWIVESSARAQKQTAYQVLIAGDRDTLARDQGNLWDSGRVAGDETSAVVYAGRPLRSHQECFWKVRVWDRDGRPSGWSKVEVWTMGLLDPSDWHQAG